MIKNEKTYRAVLRDVAQLIVGELTNETETTITLSKPSLLHVQVGSGTVNLQFIPMELVSLSPPLLLKALVEDDQVDNLFEVTFRKDQLLQIDIPLKENIFDGYIKSLEPSLLAVPANAGGLVGPNGAPLGEDIPKLQDLF
jgi:hypothetical protein